MIIIGRRAALADGMIDNEFLDQLFNLLVVVVETSAVFGGEHNVLYCLYFCGRTCQTNLFGIGIDVCSAPFHNLKVGVSLYHFSYILGKLCKLAGRCGAFEFHDALCVARAAFGSRTVYGNNTGEGSLYCLDTVFQTADNLNFTVGNFEDILCVCNLG